jgi:putative ABC transport system permease protein
VNGKLRLSSISISAADPESVDGVIAEAKRLLRQAHRLKVTDDADFMVISQSMILGVLNTIMATLTTFLGAIAGISLLVGGIGIMNIMLVSVTERTREIGLRKAVGAKRMTILTQFLVEALTLSLIGGSLGVALGYAVSWAVTVLNLIDGMVTTDSILLAFFVSTAVGLFFGIYPAWRASELRPIEALRYE